MRAREKIPCNRAGEKNLPSKGDSLAKASSRARQRDVRTRSGLAGRPSNRISTVLPGRSSCAAKPHMPPERRSTDALHPHSPPKTGSPRKTRSRCAICAITPSKSSIPLQFTTPYAPCPMRSAPCPMRSALCAPPKSSVSLQFIDREHGTRNTLPPPI